MPSFQLPRFWLSSVRLALEFWCEVRKLHVMLAVCNRNLDVCCCPLRNPFHCFFNWCVKHRCIFVQCKSVSLKMCSRHVVCIIQIHMPCRLLVLHTPLYTNIVDRKSGPFGGDLDKNAKKWLEQGALAIFWRFLTPGNKWCLDWSWFQTIYPIPIFDILFPFPVTKSQSQWLKFHFPRAKTGQSQFPFYPFRTLS